MMITISAEQLEEIESVRWADFIDNLIVSTRQRFPPHVAPLTDSLLRAAANATALRADALGFKYDDEIEQVVDLSVAFGTHFDTDPCMAWAGEILADTAFALPSEKLDFLDNNISLYSLDVFDDDSVSVPIAAFQRFANFLNDQFSDHGGGDDPEPLLRTIWPEKADACDAADLTTFVRSSKERAEHHGFDEPWSRTRFTLIGFMLGHRFDIDPFFPRLTETLGVIGPDQQMRFHNLEQLILSDVVVPRLDWARKNNGV